MKIIRLAICILVLQAGTALAADSENRFAMKGAGFLPCQAYLSAREARTSAYYMIGGWVEGYISAHNRYTADTYDITSFESLELLLALIGSHCEANPGHRLHGVVNGIIAGLEPDRLRQESPRVQIIEGERRTALSRETIRRVQVKLADRGLYEDDADGRFTEATRAALMAFQSDLDFEMTGFPDQTTLWRLLR